MGEAHKHGAKAKEAKKKCRHCKPSKDGRGERCKHDHIDMVAEDKEVLEAEEAQGLPKLHSPKTVGPTTRMLVTKRAPSIVGLRKKAKNKAASAKRKKQEREETLPGTSRGMSGGLSTAPTSIAYSAASLFQKADSLVGAAPSDGSCHKKRESSTTGEEPSQANPGKRHVPPTTAQDRHTTTDSDRLRSINAGSIHNTLAGTSKRLYMVVACLAVLAVVGLAVVLVFLFSRHRAREALISTSTNKSSPSPPTKPIHTSVKPVLKPSAPTGSLQLV